MEELIAKSYKRLIQAGVKTLEDVPKTVLPALKKIAPELFKEES